MFVVDLFTKAVREGGKISLLPPGIKDKYLILRLFDEIKCLKQIAVLLSNFQNLRKTIKL